MLHDHDTIVAPATPTGGAIAVVRVSGSGAIETVERIFRGRRPLSEAAGYTLHRGTISDGAQFAPTNTTPRYSLPCALCTVMA